MSELGKANSESLLSQKEVSVLLQVKQKTLEAWRHRGGGPRFVKLGRCVRYRLSDLHAFVTNHLRISTSDRGKGKR